MQGYVDTFFENYFSVFQTIKKNNEKKVIFFAIGTIIEKKARLVCRFFRNDGRWCNGNTTDSGPVIEGSSPSRPTKEDLGNRVFFYFRKSEKLNRNGLLIY